MPTAFLAAPVGGVVRSTGFQQQPNNTTTDSLNFRPQDVVSGRRVSATRPARVPFTSPGGDINLFAPVSGDATQTPQRTIVAARNGELHFFNGTSWTQVTSGVSVTTGRQVFATAYLRRVFIMNDTTPLVFDYGDLSLVNFVATEGTVPADNRIAVTWRGGIWLAGALSQPHVISGSRTGDPFDWDFAASGDAGAFQFTGNAEGLIGEPVSAMVPLTSDTMIIASIDSLYALRGHPRRGGILEPLSTKLGILGQGAWTLASDGTLYFLSRLGLASLSPQPGAIPSLLSNNVIPSELVGLEYDYLSPTVNLEYDLRWNGVHITDRNASSPQAWWLDLEQGGLHQMEFAEYPTTTTRFDSLESERVSGVLYGGASGVFNFDSLGQENMGYRLVVGPSQISRTAVEKAKVNRVDCHFLSGTTPDATSLVKVRTGINGDDVNAAYLNETRGQLVETGISSLLRSGGRMYPKLVGNAVQLELSGQGAGSRMVFEGASVEIEQVGRTKLIGELTTFADPLNFTTLIDTSWILGGTFAESTAAGPATGATLPFLLIDLSAMPAEWWAVVKPDGGDIRVTTSNNALMPVDLIAFDHANQTGLLATRKTFPAGVSVDVRVWCGNPSATRPGVASLYGQFNAYPRELVGFYPSGGGDDRTRYRNHTTAFGVTPGDQDGIVGLPATRYEHGRENVVGRYLFSELTMPAGTGAGVVRLNNAVQNVASELYINLTDADGLDLSLLATLGVGRFVLYATDDPLSFVAADVSSIAIDAGFVRLFLSINQASSEPSPFTVGQSLTFAYRASGADADRTPRRSLALVTNPQTGTGVTIATTSRWLQETRIAAFAQPLGLVRSNQPNDPDTVQGAEVLLSLYSAITPPSQRYSVSVFLNSADDTFDHDTLDGLTPTFNQYENNIVVADSPGDRLAHYRNGAQAGDVFPWRSELLAEEEIEVWDDFTVSQIIIGQDIDPTARWFVTHDLCMCAYWAGAMSGDEAAFFNGTLDPATFWGAWSIGGGN